MIDIKSAIYSIDLVAEEKYIKYIIADAACGCEKKMKEIGKSEKKRNRREREDVLLPHL